MESERGRREGATAVGFIGHGFRGGEWREEVSSVPREPAKATRRRRESPQNRPPSAARSRAPELRRKMAYEWSQTEGADLALGGQAEGGNNGPKHRNGLPGA